MSQPEQDDKNRKRRTTRLTSIQPAVTSVVRRGANRGRFVLKSEEGEMPPEEKKDEFGNPITDLDGDRQETDKAGAISSGVKSKLVETANSAMERLKSVLSNLEGMSTDDDAKGTPSNVAQEIKSIASVLSGVLERHPSPRSAMAGDQEDGQEKDKDGEQKKEGLEAVAEALEKAAESSLSKKDAKALRKIFVDMRKVMERVDPGAKEAVKQFDIILKAMEDDADPAVEGMASLVEELRKANAQNAALTEAIVGLEKRTAEQADKIAKMDRTVPPSNSETDDTPPPRDEKKKERDEIWDF